MKSAWYLMDLLGLQFTPMTIELRPYQVDAIKMLQSGLKKHKRQVLCLATGSGKTVVFSKMVYMAAYNGTQTLVLTHRTELFEQTFKAIEKHGISIQRIDAKNKKLDPTALVSVGMVETVERRIKKGFAIEPALIIIDEAHFGNFTKLIEHWQDAYIIGATATPVGKHFYKYYTNLVETITISELIAAGFLCDYRAFQMQDDFSDVKVSKGEFEEGSLFTHFDKAELYSGVVEKYIEKCKGKKTVVFNCNIQHSENTCQAFRSAGIESYSITSLTTKEERAEILRRYERGEFDVLNNCGILTTGWDCPAVECVVVNRATMSLPLWLQMCGRGSRPWGGKDKFTVLDFGKNHDRHGMWNEQRVWKLEEPKKKKQMAAPTKECPECYAMLFASVRICPECGYEFIPADKEAEIKDGVLVEVIRKSYEGKKLSECTMKELSEVVKSKLYSPQFIWRVVRWQGSEALKEFEKIMGYKRGWAWVQENKYKDETDFVDYTVKSK